MTVVNFRNKSNQLPKSHLFEQSNNINEINDLETKLSLALIKLQHMQAQLESLERSTSHFFDYYYEFVTNNAEPSTESQFPEIVTQNKNLTNLLNKIYKIVYEISSNDQQLPNLDGQSLHNAPMFANQDLFTNLTKLEEYLSGSNILNPTTIWQKISNMEARCLDSLQKIRYAASDSTVDSANGDLKRQILWGAVCCEELSTEIKATITKFLAA